jgi:hypothetical protein
MQTTSFDPAVDGWHFSNTDIEWEMLHEGGPSGKNLCGGMVYLALDYFNGGRAIPPDTAPPPPRSTLGQKIYARQKTAHKHTLPRLISGSIFKAITFSSDQWFVNSLATEYDELRTKIYQGKPVPLFLVGPGPGSGHHVLVIGCQSSPSVGTPALEVYDPNAPNGRSEIRVNHAAKRFTCTGTGPPDKWLGFFVDPGYEFVIPR